MKFKRFLATSYLEWHVGAAGKFNGFEYCRSVLGICKNLFLTLRTVNYSTPHLYDLLQQQELG